MSKLSLVLTVLALAASGCVYENVGSTSAALEIKYCNVTGVGVFATGEAFGGEASDTSDGESIDWTHDAPGMNFNTVSLDLPDAVECGFNRVTVAEFTSVGTATVNENPGYGYVIAVNDSRPAPEVVCETTCDGGHCPPGHNGAGQGRGHDSHGSGHGYGHDRHHGVETCTSTPAPGDPDTYSITIVDPSGVVVYIFNGEVEDGDINIEDLGAIP